MQLLEKAIEIAGGQTALAAAINVAIVDQARVAGEEPKTRLLVTPQKVSYWLGRKKGVVPAEYVLPIEHATNKKITRHELRPDLYPENEYGEQNGVVNAASGTAGA